jgi:hypothetical protein
MCYSPAPMKTACHILIALLALVTAVPVDAGPEHARLTALAGTREVEISFWFKPGGEAVTSKGKSTIRPLLDGLFIEEKLEGTLFGKPFTTLAWTGYNTHTKQYEATRIATTNTIRVSEAGTFDPAARAFELKAEYPFDGSTWRQRTVITLTGNKPATAVSYLSFGDVPEWKGVEIRYGRTRK